MNALPHRVAVVTGASGGIGAGLATMLASEGAGVVLAARRKEALEHVASCIREAGGVALPVVTDLSDDMSLTSLVERTRAEFGPIDILVNNAGYAAWQPLEATSMAEWDHTFAVNLRAAAYLCMAALPDMLSAAAIASRLPMLPRQKLCGRCPLYASCTTISTSEDLQDQ